MRALDWAVTSVGVYEIASLFLSTYRANSIWYAEIVVLAVLMYLVVRMAIVADWQVLIVAGLIGARRRISGVDGVDRFPFACVGAAGGRADWDRRV